MAYAVTQSIDPQATLMIELYVPYGRRRYASGSSNRCRGAGYPALNGPMQMRDPYASIGSLRDVAHVPLLFQRHKLLGIRGTVKQPITRTHPKGIVARNQQERRVVTLEPHIATHVFPLPSDACVEISSAIKPNRTMSILSK